MTETPLPLFMADDLPSAEPKLDPTTIVVGTEVMVAVPNSTRRGRASYIRAKVTEQGRIWIIVAPIDKESFHASKTWRLRLDTQHDGKDTSYRVHFYSPEQFRYREARAEAVQFVTTEQGLRTDYSSPWHHRHIELARIIWKGIHGDA